MQFIQLLFHGKSVCNLRFLIFQFGKRGKVAPILSQYGRIFHTHRIFRHYVYTLVLPITVYTVEGNINFFNNVEYLWSIHANRLNQK